MITVCTAGRRPLLAKPDIVDLLSDLWRLNDAWLVGRFIVLPDHLHAFCAPGHKEAAPLAAWIRFWKSLASRRWPRPDEYPIWQAGFWDRQLRSGEHYGRRWEYVRANPVRHGYTHDPDAWPYQGELNVFRFHDG